MACVNELTADPVYFSATLVHAKCTKHLCFSTLFRRPHFIYGKTGGVMSEKNLYFSVVRGRTTHKNIIYNTADLQRPYTYIYDITQVKISVNSGPPTGGSEHLYLFWPLSCTGRILNFEAKNIPNSFEATKRIFNFCFVE